MNREDVKASLNVNSTASWSECANIDYTQQREASQWIYPHLKGVIRILHYGGDTDGVVPQLGTQRWMKDLGWPVTERWRPWMIEKYRQGGFFEAREDMDFLTIHGTGHMAPQWKREESKMGVLGWIRGETLAKL